MERAWSRRAPLLDLPRPRIEALVGKAFPGATLRGVEPLSGGLRNTNLALTLDGAPSPLVLRAYVADRAACCREASVLVSLPAGVAVPHVLHAESDDDPPWALLEWLDGVPADRALGADPGSALAFAAECGEVLARVHGIRFPACGFLGPALAIVEPLPRWSDALPGIAAAAGEWLGRRLVASLEACAADAAAHVDALWDSAVLCHGDFKLWNLLARPDARPGPGGLGLAGVLDWEFAFAGPALFDFATFLRDEASRPPGYAEAFAEGYLAGGGELPRDWRRLAALLDLINLCQLISGGGDDGTADDLIPLIEQTLSR